jgi:hypothetical protein
MLHGTLHPSPQSTSPNPSKYGMVNIWAIAENPSFGQQYFPSFIIFYAA